MKKNMNTTKNQEQAKKSTLAQKLLTGLLIVCLAAVCVSSNISTLAGDIVFFSSLALGVICGGVLAKLQPETDTNNCSQCDQSDIPQ